ncbi:MAG: FIG00664615: hypothetical protein, partial [uncultured Nocardioides sp.]
DRTQRPRRPARALQHRPGDRLLPGRHVHGRTGGRRRPRHLHRGDGSVPRPPAVDRQRPRHPASGMGVRRSGAGGSVVRRRGPVAPGLRRRVARPGGARLDARGGARRRAPGGAGAARRRRAAGPLAAL